MRRLMPVVFLAAFACKPAAPTESQVQSLDNFAGGGTINACEGQYHALPTAVIKAQSEQAKEVRQALTAIPPALQSAFFEDLRGQIVVQRDLSACKEAGVTSCWTSVGDTSVAVYVKDAGSDTKTAQNIRHALVRSFGYMTVQLMLKLKNEAQGTTLTDNPPLADFKSDLAMTFLDDVAKHPKYDLKAFKNSLSGDLIDENSKSSERRAAWNSQRGTPRGETFMDSVLAEAFDSWYCSAKSRANLERDFSNTFVLMKAYAGTLEMGFSGQFAADGAQPSAEGSGDGFGLWGGWGAGNGPLRQMWGNWGSWRQEGRGLFNFGRAQQGGGWIFPRGGFFG